MVKIGLKWSKMVKMVKNGGPELKRARRTGLSARRARRTKSRGPKGLQLEVGARRAPRLLVYHNVSFINFHSYVSASLGFPGSTFILLLLGCQIVIECDSNWIM